MPIRHTPGRELRLSSLIANLADILKEFEVMAGADAVERVDD